MDLNQYCYICYSVNLYNRFKNNNIKFFKKGLDTSTNKMFWIYPKSEEVIKILKEWSDGVGK